MGKIIILWPSMPRLRDGQHYAMRLLGVFELLEGLACTGFSRDLQKWRASYARYLQEIGSP